MDRYISCQAFFPGGHYSVPRCATHLSATCVSDFLIVFYTVGYPGDWAALGFTHIDSQRITISRRWHRIDDGGPVFAHHFAHLINPTRANVGHRAANRAPWPTCQFSGIYHRKNPLARGDGKLSPDIAQDLVGLILRDGLNCCSMGS